jgi:hypothetical protein
MVSRKEYIKEYNEGKMAFEDGVDKYSNPYVRDWSVEGYHSPSTQKHDAWATGFATAQEKAEAKQFDIQLSKVLAKLAINKEDLKVLKKYFLKDLKEGQTYYIEE